MVDCSIFYRMKFVKNDWRSRLGDRNHSDLMLIFMETDLVETYDPTAAVQIWYSAGVRVRRPTYMDDMAVSDFDFFALKL